MKRAETRGLIRMHTDTVQFDVSKCTRCGLCVSVCVGRVIHPDTASVEHASCIRCGHCLAVCPEGALSLGPSAGDPPRTGKIDPEAFEALVRARRSLRVYRDEDIPRETLDRLIALLAYAPTGTNSRPVGVTVIQGRSRVKAFVDAVMGFFMKAALIFGNPFLRPFVYLILGARIARKALGFSKRYFGRYRAGEDVLAHGAPCVIVFHAPRSASTPEQDAVIAATTASLHAETLGLGSCFNGFIVYGLKFSRALRRSIGIPDKSRVYSALLLGLPRVKYARIPPRPPIASNLA